MQIKRCFSSLKKQKKPFKNFHKECESILIFVLIWYQLKTTQYNTVNIQLSNSQLNKLKSGIENGAEVTLNLPSNVIGNSNDEVHFPHQLLFSNTQVSRLCKAFANNSSINLKLSKA